MIWFLIRRIGWIAITLWVVFTISFVLMRSMPGGPFDNERQLDPEILRNIERKYHLDESLPKQYWRRLTETLRFDLGPCYRMSDYSVNEVIAQGLPVSASLGILALAWAILLGVAAGVIAAV